MLKGGLKSRRLETCRVTNLFLHQSIGLCNFGHATCIDRDRWWLPRLSITCNRKWICLQLLNLIHLLDFLKWRTTPLNNAASQSSGLLAHDFFLAIIRARTGPASVHRGVRKHWLLRRRGNDILSSQILTKGPMYPTIRSL